MLGIGLVGLVRSVVGSEQSSMVWLGLVQGMMISPYAFVSGLVRDNTSVSNCRRLDNLPQIHRNL